MGCERRAQPTAARTRGAGTRPSKQSRARYAHSGGFTLGCRGAEAALKTRGQLMTSAASHRRDVSSVNSTCKNGCGFQSRAFPLAASAPHETRLSARG
ncbi:hypothetical protein AAFF_G00314340 [Aldrovandia affinis]|uniref:Uncharacterized protein n=1 Tax=Aldrovandia affinis TaxID=143900 RepID=A0AAD7R7D8_9TELE|nr:hypothetical protein AAFF_G00314340 [Aldrovandia affinis]